MKFSKYCSALGPIGLAAIYPLVSVGALAAAALCVSMSVHAEAQAVATDQPAEITPQAMRAPELPVG